MSGGGSVPPLGLPSSGRARPGSFAPGYCLPPRWGCCPRRTVMADHAWVLANVAGYLADGLDASERAEFETHIAGCPACATALEDARAVDQRLSALFADARPRPGLEDRMIRRLRVPPAKVRRSFSLLIRVVVVAAAVVLVGAL